MVREHVTGVSKAMQKIYWDSENDLCLHLYLPKEKRWRINSYKIPRNIFRNVWCVFKILKTTHSFKICLLLILIWEFPFFTTFKICQVFLVKSLKKHHANITSHNLSESVVLELHVEVESSNFWSYHSEVFWYPSTNVNCFMVLSAAV